MLKNYLAVTIGVFALLIASTAVYGILTVNSTIQAKQEPIKIPDYSAKIDSIKSQVDSISNNLPALDTLKTNMTDIHEKLAGLDNMKSNIADIQQKLANLENKNSQVQQIASVSDKLTIVLTKSGYFPSDTIHITAIGAEPQKVVQVQLLDNNGFILIHKQTWADSTGQVIYDLQLSSALVTGDYQIKLVSDQQTDSQPITIQNPTATTSSYTFTAQTDKTFYQRGDIIQVSGRGQPNTGVTAVLSSPSGVTYNLATTTQNDGSYILFFPTYQSYETGNWHIAVSNFAQTKVVSIYIQQ